MGGMGRKRFRPRTKNVRNHHLMHVSSEDVKGDVKGDTNPRNHDSLNRKEAEASVSVTVGPWGAFKEGHCLWQR